MKVTLSPEQTFCLAEEFARVIHGQIVEMHLRVTNDLCQWQFPIERRNSSFKEVQFAVCSIEDKWERRLFITSIRFHLNKQCKEHGTDRKWQDYRARVEAHRMKEAA